MENAATMDARIGVRMEYLLERKAETNAPFNETLEKPSHI